MGEILDFPKTNPKRNTTAMGRFFMAVEEQTREQEEQRLKRLAKVKPTIAEIAAAQKELQMIFGGENAQEAQRMYNQGRDDLVHSRTAEISREEKYQLLDEFASAHGFVILGAALRNIAGVHTPAALFYIHVECLSEIANRAYDKPRHTQ